MSKVICDVCGAQVNKEWCEILYRNGDVVCEKYAPIDLCDEHIPCFTLVADKWAQERYERRELTDKEREACILDVAKAEEVELEKL